MTNTARSPQPLLLEEIQNPSDLSSIFLRQAPPPRQGSAPYYISSSLQLTNVQHGRGLVAVCDISPGELLLVTPPTVACNVKRVQQQWLVAQQQEQLQPQQAHTKNNDNIDAVRLLERLAEQDLLQAMRQAVDHNHVAVVKSFQTLQRRTGPSSSLSSSNTKPDTTVTTDRRLMDQLLGKDNTITTRTESANATAVAHDDILTNDDLRQIIRKNAFGPDFVTFPVIVKQWQRLLSNKSNKNNDSNNSKTIGLCTPHRILGLYPLAAMINHSCHPNAVRVYSGHDDEGIMVVHANQAIPAGQEIVWSYIPPTLSFPVRQAMLQQPPHEFVCTCDRCTVERPFFERIMSSDSNNNINITVNQLVQWQQQQQEKTATTTSKQVLSKAVESLEQGILTEPNMTNELARYLRVGFMDIYMHYLNTTSMATTRATTTTNHTTTTTTPKTTVAPHSHDDETLLNLCTQLHFSFCTCDNASTGHLSILHLCYELMGRIHHSHADQSMKTLPKLRFWTEQVKRACMIRYGALGQQLEAVRTVMKHSRLVLRQQDGLEQAEYCFI